MKLNEAVLNMLGFCDDFVSGQEMAKTLRVSRTAIWKAIGKLCDEGYIIESDKVYGYRLSDKNIRLCLPQIEKYCGDTQIILLDSTTSTNDYAKALANEGAGENTLVIARNQTNGRGRTGKTFISKDGGLYMSLILRPNLKPQDSLQITVAAAAAMSRAIMSVCDIQTQIKWVNDLYLNSKKVCGILTEGAICAEDASLQYAILGIGLNVALPKGGFDKEIKKIATSLYKKQEVESKIYSKIIAEFLCTFFEYYADLNRRNYMPYFREHLFLQGKKIEYEKNGVRFVGMVIGVDDDARLLVEHKGKTEALSTGEVQIKL